MNDMNFQLNNNVISNVVAVLLLSALIICPSHQQADENCDDPYECFSQTINKDGTVRCNGDHGCAQASIISEDLDCQGAYSCFEAIKLSSDLIECQGLMSCSSVDRVQSSTFLRCRGELSCVDSNLYASLTNDTDDSISCFGDRSCMDSSLQGRHIVFYGGLSGLNSIIYANSSLNSTIKFYGNEAGYNSTIICGDNTKCSVECQTNGCNNLTLKCQTDNQCILNVDCTSAEQSPLCPDGTCFSRLLFFLFFIFCFFFFHLQFVCCLFGTR